MSSRAEDLAQEAEALEAIFPDGFQIVEPDSMWRVRIGMEMADSGDDCSISLLFHLPPSYPETEPPTMTLETDVVGMLPELAAGIDPAANANGEEPPSSVLLAWLKHDEESLCLADASDVQVQLREALGIADAFAPGAPCVYEFAATVETAFRQVVDVVASTRREDGADGSSDADARVARELQEQEDASAAALAAQAADEEAAAIDYTAADAAIAAEAAAAGQCKTKQKSAKPTDYFQLTWIRFHP